MQLLKSTIHPDVEDITLPTFKRKATRAIVLNDSDILLLYTARYHDYSLPGGGIDEGESLEQALARELKEETGAQNVTNIRAFGLYEEFRPWYKDDADIVHMESYCFLCDIADELAEPELEDYEQNNGMEPRWVNIHQAIAHNERTIANSPKKGMSVERETFLLKRIAQQFEL